MSKSAKNLAVSCLALLLLPSVAVAHPGGGEGGLVHGLMHPFSGLDHVCAMLAVGLWAAQSGGRSVWAVPLAFVGVLALGSALGVLGVALPFAEQGVVLSVLLLGMLVAAAVRLPLWLSSSVAGLFALWHGHAHGAEMPEAASGMAYALGLMLATVSLHVAGIGFGLAMQQRLLARVVRLAGAAVVLCGVYLVSA